MEQLQSYFDRDIGELIPFSCQMQSSFSFEIIFLHFYFEWRLQNKLQICKILDTLSVRKILGRVSLSVKMLQPALEDLQLKPH